MSIVRMIYVTVSPKQSAEVERVWKQHCGPLLKQQPGCVSEHLLGCIDAAGEYISYSEWKDQKSIDTYRKSEAHEKILNHTRDFKGEKPVVKRYKVT